MGCRSIQLVQRRNVAHDGPCKLGTNIYHQTGTGGSPLEESFTKIDKSNFDYFRKEIPYHSSDEDFTAIHKMLSLFFPPRKQR
jgi:hypothetical protein